MSTAKNAAAAAAPAVVAGAKVRYLRVDTESPAHFVHAGGQGWAGRSEVPLASITPANLAALKADARLQLEEIERDAEPDAA